MVPTDLDLAAKHNMKTYLEAILKTSVAQAAGEKKQGGKNSVYIL